jgi:hypothetical protein
VPSLDQVVHSEATPARGVPVHDRLDGIPRVGPRTAAIFRILLACALGLAILFDDSIGRPDAGAVAYAPGSGYGTGTWPVAHWIRRDPSVHAALLGIAGVFTVTFGAGLLTRVSAALLWASLFLLVSASLVTVGNHAWGAPLLALLGLVLSPLGDAWSVDAWRRRRTRGPDRGPGERPAYGFAMWWIGLVLGISFLAAAYAKLTTSGVDWVTGGAIRYHFIEDAANAVVPWGIWIAARPRLAVAISAAAILIEVTLILVVFCRPDRHRLAFGLAGLSLHVGFFLFQGVLWWPWIILYLAFLPWNTLSRRIEGHRVPTPPAGRRRRSPTPALAVVALLILQIYASAAQREYEPLVSHYPMYSGTFPSWDAFFETRRWYKYQRYRFVLTSASGGQLDLSEAVPLISAADRARLIDTMYALHAGKAVDERSTVALAALKRRIAGHVQREVDTIEVFVDVQAVNVEAMRIDMPVRNMHAFTLRLSPPALQFVEPAFAGTFTGLCDSATVMSGTLAPGPKPPAPSAGRTRPAC